MEVLNDILWQPCFKKGGGNLFHNSRGLGRRLQNNRIASQDGGNQTVDQDEIGILIQSISIYVHVVAGTHVKWS